MKKAKIALNVGALLIAVVCAFAFKSAPVKTVAFQTFELVPGGTQLDPLDYQVSSGPSCTGLAQVCTIDALSASEVYTAAESLSVHGNLDYVDKPKVDISTAMQNDIAAAIADNSSSSITLPSGRVIEKKP